MELGGPVWHASASASLEGVGWAMAERALRGVGDAQLGEWREHGQIAVHIRRRLTDAERKLAAGERVLEVRDIRGTPEEASRLRRLLRDAPDLRRVLEVP